MPSNPRWTYRVRFTDGLWWGAASVEPVDRLIVTDDGLWQSDYRTNTVYWLPLADLSWQELRRVGKYQCGITVPREGGHDTALRIVRDHLDGWLMTVADTESRERACSQLGIPFAGGGQRVRPSRPVSATGGVTSPVTPRSEPVVTVDDDATRAFGAIIAAARQAALDAVGNMPSASGGSSVDVSELTERIDGVDRRQEATKDMAFALSGLVRELQEANERLSGDVQRALIHVNQSRVIEVRSPFTGATTTVQGAHHMFDTLLARTADGIQSWLYGPAGTGKSTLAKQVFEAMGLRAVPLSVTPDMMRHHFFGTVNALTGEFRETAFYQAYKNGWGILLDECDNATASFLNGLNDGLASQSMTFDNGEVVERHPMFRCIAAGNTVGHGATAMYRRNQLDEATLDRFTYCYIGLDESIEDAGVAARLSDQTAASDLIRVVRVARRNVDTHNLRMVVTPRAAFDGARMLELGEPMLSVVRDRILRGCSRDVGDKILDGTGFTFDQVMGG